MSVVLLLFLIVFFGCFVPKVLLTLLHIILTLLSTFYSYYTVIYVHYSD